MATNTTSTVKKRSASKPRRDWRIPFIEALTKSPSVTHAAVVAGIDRSTAYREYNNDPAFADLWEDAVNAAIELAEHELYRRAVEGVDKPVTVAGEREIVKEYSDTLLIFFLKTRKPDTYRDISNVNANIKITKLNDAELKQYIEQRIARIGLGAGRGGETTDTDQNTVIIEGATEEKTNTENG
jgi:hypothetical protein